MKFLKLFEQNRIGKFRIDEKEIIRMLKISQQKGDIEIKTSIKNVIDNIKHYHPEIGTFKSFVISENEFFSEGDKGRIKQYIEEFKKLGIDTSKLESLKPGFDHYQGIQRAMDVYHMEDEEYNNLVEEEEKYQEAFDKFAEELENVRLQARKIMYPDL